MLKLTNKVVGVGLLRHSFVNAVYNNNLATTEPKRKEYGMMLGHSASMFQYYRLNPEYVEGDPKLYDNLKRLLKKRAKTKMKIKSKTFP